MEKLFGVVILYNPAENVKDYISGYLPFLDELLILDNSEPASTIDFGDGAGKVTVVRSGENKGIAARLNEAARYAISKEACWLLTMDQDSFFSGDSMKQYLWCLNAFPDKGEVAMFGVEFEAEPEGANCAARETDQLITSGSIVNLEIFRKLEGFDENLFIDEVDFEYCARAAKLGYKTLQFRNIYLNHSLGSISMHRSLKSLKKTTRTLHAPSRLYYMLRNYLYLREIYEPVFPESLKAKKKALLNRIKNNLFYGSNRVMTLKYLVNAYQHYKEGKMGRLRN